MQDSKITFAEPLIHEAVPRHRCFGGRALVVFALVSFCGVLPRRWQHVLVAELAVEPTTDPRMAGLWAKWLSDDNQRDPANFATNDDSQKDPAIEKMVGSLDLSADPDPVPESRMTTIVGEPDVVVRPMYPHPMNIAVVMWYDYPAELQRKFADKNFEMNTAYCDLHGYTLIWSKADRLPDKKLQINWGSKPWMNPARLKAAWQRVSIVASYLHNFSYVMYMDADAFFYRDAAPLHELIAEADRAVPGGADLILSRDADFAATRGKPPLAKTREDEVDCNINAGVFIARATKRIHRLLDRWERLGDTEIDDQESLRTLWLKDELGMRNWTYVVTHGDFETFVPIHLRHDHRLVPFMNNVPGCPDDMQDLLTNHLNPIVCHLAGSSNYGRVLICRDYALQWGLEGETIIEGFLKNPQGPERGW
eukprot:gnl/TRDRNA2_/TRDRNA2_91582_c0_seq1.p1 gnl/TRDRNA2_/TRDRNA2_91582_c0~~gnl/TRDRNA2_/TRDRNA2_91582_c0_seq1.p1  ORF type:complete len:422 (-),score=56.52 gnl/TRDRNA2_/TRDRNA2_91582_c0_seq1:52-1317(-)